MAAERPYKSKIYHPFYWRGWQAFANGQLGDFGCHILDPVFKALELKAPTRVVADAPPMNTEVWTNGSHVKWTFPATARTTGPIAVSWHDGEGKHPPREGLGLPEDYKLPVAGSVLVGERGSLVIPHVAPPELFPEAALKDYELPQVTERNHYTDWAHCCLDGGQPGSNFDYAGPLTETVLLGLVATRLPGQTLEWNADALQVTNHRAANVLLSKPYRKGWEPAWL